MLIGRLCGGRSVMFWPSRNTRPSLGFSKPARMRSRVDLPEPEPPSRANISPRLILRVTSSTATASSNCLVTRSILTNSTCSFLAMAGLMAPAAPTIGFLLHQRKEGPRAAPVESAARLDAVPGAGNDPLRCQRTGFGHKQVGHYLVAGVDRRVVQHFRVDEFIGRQVRVGIGD